MESRESLWQRSNVARLSLIIVVLVALVFGQFVHRLIVNPQRFEAASAVGVSNQSSPQPRDIDLAALAQPVIGAGDCQFFQETNYSVCDVFLNYWRHYGGLTIFGYPISWEIFEDGRTVQYFERSKLEYHPELAGTEWAVVGELMGRTITTTRAAEAPFQRLAGPRDEPSCYYHPETAHDLCGGFRGYWEANGGLWMFGYPISQEFQEFNADTGQTYTVQYFERARFEWHPEYEGTQHEVLLGRLGFQLYNERHPDALPQQRFNIRDFGAKGDGVTDDTDAIGAALQAARNVVRASGVVYVPEGTYRVRSTSSDHSSKLVLHRDSVLVGDGPDRSVLKVIANSVEPGWPNLRVLIVASNTRVNGLGFDGSRDEFDRNVITNVSTSMIRTRTGADSVVFENLKVQNVYGQKTGGDFKEAFGIATGGASNATVRQIEAMNNDGAGISTNGDIYGAESKNVLIENILSHHNRSMGITFYGARDSIARGIVAFANSRGVNIEWSHNLTIEDVEAFDNDRRGISLIGHSTGIRVVNATTWNNGANYPSGSELGLVAGSWEFPDPNTGVIARGINQDITLVNCNFTPAANGVQVYIKPDTVGATVGDVFPSSVLLQSPGWESWRFNINNIIVNVADVPTYVQTTFGVSIRTQ